MVSCKNCQSIKTIKSGLVNGKQRYKCKECGCHFVEGDRRTSADIQAKKALCVVLYSLGKMSMRMIGRVFSIHHTLVLRWLVEAGARIPEQGIDSETREVEFDEMWRFVENKLTSSGPSRLLTVTSARLLHGLSVVVILQHSNGSATNSNI